MSIETILDMLSGEQHEDPEEFLGDVTLVLATGDKVTGLLESTADGVVSIRRRLARDLADIPRHYATSSIIGAYYTTGS